jgi:hypothetical protein
MTDTQVTWLTQESHDRLKAKRAICARTVATTRPAKIRASRRPAFVSCRTC